jgi:hypothetical protein
MTQPTHFQRIYRDFVGPEYRADETVARTVIAAMNEAARGSDPFKVRFKMADGSVLLAKARRG